MKILLSPSKSQDFETKAPTKKSTNPRFTPNTSALVSEMKKYSVQDLIKTMHISESLALLNKTRYRTWAKAPEKQALFAFTGDVYRAFMNADITNQDINYLEKHVRIISGLYGALTPLTKIKPYRLEMGRNIPITFEGRAYASLYAFWKEPLTNFFAKEDCIVNLASNEYAKAIDFSKLSANVITIEFRTRKNGVARIIPVFAKQERGAMTLWLAQNNILNPEKIKTYKENSYSFDKKLSSDSCFVFVR